MGLKTQGIRIRVDGKWMHLSDEMIHNHPGGNVITQYANADATHMFHAFHEGSGMAYKQLEILKKQAWDKSEDLEEYIKKRDDKIDVNVSTYDITIEQEKNITQRFEQLRQDVHRLGLMEAKEGYYYFKMVSTMSIMLLAFVLQYQQWYLLSACVMAVCWQQLGWMTHEFCHHQPFKNRRQNDRFGLFFGNIAQGFASDWWKDKHNTHHATTNMIDHDGDIDLAPLITFVPADLLKYKEPFEKAILKLIPYQHLYYTAMLPVLRFSWLAQSLQFAFVQNKSKFRQYRENAFDQQLGLVIHWGWVLFQLYLLPSWPLRIAYFLISQAGSGFLIAHVVTFNHNSVDKYPANSRILNNFAALQILTTRNMTPSPFIDWLWGGLNYQVEHHLFPTMPRCNLNKCSVLVKQFCKDTSLEYLCDDFFVGYGLNLEQLEKMAKHVEVNVLEEEDEHRTRG
ncbi:unnamed protein product, partial [Mesorhabditis belari]|uniref:Fatty acid desaturase domain-containing protein n=1 Tax=Mesorhabditis belari TaxID=2138241 RepID=A0AAF3FPP9_9BILA